MKRSSTGEYEGDNFKKFRSIGTGIANMPNGRNRTFERNDSTTTCASSRTAFSDSTMDGWDTPDTSVFGQSSLYEKFQKANTGLYDDVANSAQSMTTAATTAPAKPASSWVVCEAHPEDERYINVLPKNSYQAAINKLDVRYQVQWELERMIAKDKLISWTDFRMDDLQPLKGDIATAMPEIERVCKAVVRRKGGGKVDPGAETAEVLGITDRKTLLYAEMDREEESIRQQDYSGVGNNDVKWSFGGKLAYTVIVQPCKAGPSACIQYTHAPPTPTKADPTYRQTSTDSPSGPIDNADNPLGIASQHQPDPPTPLPYRMSLARPALSGKSYRLARRFGSRRILIFKLKGFTSESKKRVCELFIGRCFVLFGRTLRALWAPNDSDNVLAVETGSEKGFVSRGRMEPDMPSFSVILASRFTLSKDPCLMSSVQ